MFNSIFKISYINKYKELMILKNNYETIGYKLLKIYYLIISISIAIDKYKLHYLKRYKLIINNEQNL